MCINAQSKNTERKIEIQYYLVLEQQINQSESIRNMPADEQESKRTNRDIDQCGDQIEGLIDSLQMGSSNHQIYDVNQIIEQIKTH